MESHLRDGAFLEHTPPERSRLCPGRAVNVYVSSELIILTCTPSNDLHPISSHLLYKVGEVISVNSRYYSLQSHPTYIITNTGTDINDYYWVYSRSMFGRIVMSKQTETVRIKVVVVVRAQGENDLGRPEKPLLSPELEEKVYVSGERVTFTCTSSECRDIIRFLLYEGVQFVTQKLTDTSGQDSAMFTITEPLVGSKSYTCTYTCNVNGTIVESNKSTPVQINIVARPQKPQISCDQKEKVYASDESVIFTCWTTDRTYSADTFYLYNDRQPVSQRQSQQNSATFTITNRRVAPRDYYCDYTCRVYGRRISSGYSSRIKITFVDLPRPNISQVPSHVSEGEDVTFNCTSTKNTSVNTFNLYKNSVQLNDSVPQSADAQNKSETVEITHVSID
ncbi:uncharacterized protein LOC132380682 [Hypanus sabinus]|uniref:uncharacterized protein LOC132380682 n=1 Tax=Hypanus sabinus TaxID=79690 RepID=UPI0028C37B0D|nr:uncharacterized protein LOC132380682 [Hypanus sabinus]